MLNLKYRKEKNKDREIKEIENRKKSIDKNQWYLKNGY